MTQTSKITLLNPLVRCLAMTPVSVGLLTLGLPQFPAIAGDDWNQFNVCITELAKYNVDREIGARACSDALIPKELSECVSMIGEATPIKGDDALKACYQVRRPIDLGNCVADIYNAIPSLSASETKQEDETMSEDTPLLALLNSCRSSLRPGFYSECVIAVNREVRNITAVQALDKCLAAEDFPRDIFPAYEPQ
ncbi:conserved hypothetical protein [Rippkaea orientalis PCC 8801]|uniref:Uncharacterized protein n=1 Tax=Rippkaea orientalis (strain PCC 8801 / RF-1) TaxID=41431 RepID=B7K4H0_RIPO1|nr:hypothetical protein [Rippkaea orientalis]ACK65435.1 conserved hypothetical protein [Rippkaea orientalis PCC 8801]